MQFDIVNKTFKPETDQEWNDYLALVMPVDRGFTPITRKEEASEERTVVLAHKQKDAPRAHN